MIGICEGGGFSKRSPSLALPPEEWLGFELILPSSNMPLRVGAVSFKLVESTAANRAAADMCRGESLLEVCMFRYLKKNADD